MNQENNEISPADIPRQEENIAGNQTLPLQANISEYFCDCPLNGDLYDISGKDNHLSGMRHTVFTRDPTDLSRKVLMVNSSESGSVVRLYAPISGNYVVETDFYSEKKENEQLSFHLAINGNKICVCIPDSVIIINTWLKLRVEIEDGKNAISIMHSVTGEVIREEKDPAPLSSSAPKQNMPFITVGYHGWKGKTLKGYLKNFKVIMLSGSNYILTNEGEYLITHDDQRIIQNNA